MNIDGCLLLLVDVCLLFCRSFFRVFFKIYLIY